MINTKSFPRSLHLNFQTRLSLFFLAMGLLLVLTGILFLTGAIQTMAYWLQETFPLLQEIG